MLVLLVMVMLELCVFEHPWYTLVWSATCSGAGVRAGRLRVQAKQTVYTNVGAGIRSTAPQAEASVNSGATGGRHTGLDQRTRKVWTSVGLYRPGEWSFTFFLEDMMMEGVLRKCLGDVVKHLQVQGVMA